MSALDECFTASSESHLVRACGGPEYAVGPHDSLDTVYSRPELGLKQPQCDSDATLQRSYKRQLMVFYVSIDSRAVVALLGFVFLRIILNARCAYYSSDSNILPVHMLAAAMATLLPLCILMSIKRTS